MEISGVQKSLSLTIRSSGILQSGVFLGYCGLKFERRFKVVLLSGTMGVLGSLAAYAGPTGLPFGAEFEKMGPAGPVASQTTDECLPSDIACLLLRPVGAVPGAPRPERENGARTTAPAAVAALRAAVLRTMIPRATILLATIPLATIPRATIPRATILRATATTALAMEIAAPTPVRTAWKKATPAILD